MKYSYEGIREYLEGNYSVDELKNFLEKLGLNPIILEGDSPGEFEIEIPSNRADLTSITGLARSLLPLGDFKFHFPDFKIITHTDKKLPVEISSYEDCYCYAGRCIENVKVSPSSCWLKKKVESAGFRSVNNVVDITNFVFWELGQPMHAFDKDLINSKIFVRRASDGEQIVTLDGVKRTLNREILVIADNFRPVAIAGIMGGVNSQVNEKTTNLFLESAFFNPAIIRKSSKILGLRTEASSKFEKNIDPEIIVTALDRCCKLINELCGGETGELILTGSYKTKERVISLGFTRLNSYLGYDVSVNLVEEIFNRLGFQTGISGDLLNVSVPSYRQDVIHDVDLIEEIAKYHGYEKIHEEIPVAVITPSEDDSTIFFINETKDILTKLGFSEVINLGLVSMDEINNFEMGNLNPVEILNPVSMNFSHLRPSLVIELLKNFQRNSAYKNENLALFEIGNTYFLSDNKPTSDMAVSLGIMDTGDHSGFKGFSTFKGKIEYFLKTYFYPVQVQDYVIDFERDERNTGIYYNIILENIPAKEPQKDILGFIFEPAQSLLEKYDLQGKEIFISQIDLEVLKNKGFLKSYFDKNKTPSISPIRRDLSLVVKAGPESEWRFIVDNLYIPELLSAKDKIKIFDIYSFSAREKKELQKKFGFKEPVDILGLGISIFFSNEKGNLTKDNIDNKVHKIIETLEKSGVRLRHEQI
ncbi:MAG: phenylalanine--tRNA ligase subunit beta [Candidatus Omnitrophica bacterium]|nr:phenylalanine--tRNA ligase subunit beta [Candidatus Omnitrophota bacterium]